MQDTIVILTGAGISAESGIATFRASDGLWENHRIEDVATPEGFAANPDLVHDFYNARRAKAQDAQPNAAHIALARLQSEFAGDVYIVTQNVDDLHERGGAKVVHMHGALNSALCAACQTRWDAPNVMHKTDTCPNCGTAATRPDIVWFGEMPYFMDEIADRLVGCTTFVAIGTSGQVYPAAGFVQEARNCGAETIEINLEPTGSQYMFDRQITGKATQTVPAWVDEVLGA